MSTHGEARRGKRSPEYRAWIAMRQRCYLKTHKRYKDWGGRGIAVCGRWLGHDGFQNFLADMGRKPSPELTLERNDNDGNYEPRNCRWATRKEQVHNRRPSTIGRATAPESRAAA